MSHTAPEAAPAGWAFDERASAGRENLDPEHVRRYDAKEDAGAADELALLQRLGLDGTSTLVDLGAGTGQLALLAADVAARTIAVDISPVMIDHLRAKAAAAGLHDLEVVQGGFLTYEHTGAPADFAYSRFALHHLPDFWKALALWRVRALLRPGGVLRLWDVVYDFAPHEATGHIEAWCAQYEGASEGQWNRADVEEHVRDEHSTFTWLLEPLIERCGFVLEQVEHSPDGFFARYVARAA